MRSTQSSASSVAKSAAKGAASDTAQPSLRLDDQLCFALYSAMLGVNKAYRLALADLSLTYPQYLVMLVLWERDGLTVSQIGEQLFLESPTLTPLLKRLEQSGHVHRARSLADERQVIVSLTPTGRALRSRARRVPSAVAQSMACSSDEIAGMRQRLVALRTRLFQSA